MNWLCWASPLIRILLIIVHPFMEIYLRIWHPLQYRYYRLSEWAKHAYCKKKYTIAETHALELLQLSETLPRDWNYGNAIDRGNQILGLVSLARGEVNSAKEYLKKAGNTPGSPQLDSYGPRMMLARELLKLGERDIVLDYLESVEKFMLQDKPNMQQYEWYAPYLAEKRNEFEQWKNIVRIGRIPAGKNWEPWKT